MKSPSITPLPLDCGYSRNWNPYAGSAVVLNEASTLHERVAYCWGLAHHLQEISSLLLEHSSPEVARVAGTFYEQMMPLTGMLRRVGADTALLELSGGSA